MAEEMLFGEEAGGWSMIDGQNGTNSPCDGIQQDSDQQQHFPLAILWWTNAVCLPAIAALGLICNGLNLLVLAGNEQARRMPSWHLLIALALFDSLFLLCVVLELALPISLNGRPSLVSAHTRMVLFLRMLASSFYKSSILIVVAFNVERYLCVCRPLWAHRAGILRGRAGNGGKCRFGVIGIAFGIGLLCSLQWPLAWRVVECGASDDHMPAYSIVTISESAWLQAYYRLMDWFSLFAFNLCPIALLSVLNLQLVLTLRRIVRRDSSASSTLQMDEGQEPNGHGQISALESNNAGGGGALNANAMLFAVVLLLFICIGPQAPARLLYEWYGHYHVDAILYTCISQQLVFLNASLNFCLYCLVSRRYRSLLKETLLTRFGIGPSGSGHRRNWIGAKFTPAIQNNNAQSSNSSSAGASRDEDNFHQHHHHERHQQQQPFLQLELMRRGPRIGEGRVHVINVESLFPNVIRPNLLWQWYP